MINFFIEHVEEAFGIVETLGRLVGIGTGKESAKDPWIGINWKNMNYGKETNIALGMSVHKSI